MKVLALEFWVNPETDRVYVKSETLQSLTAGVILPCLGEAIEQTLQIAEAVAKDANLTPGEMSKMMRAHRNG